MEFKQLEAFVAVVDYGSFSEAARRLYLTQPTISAHIRSLEDELHMKLIIRTTKKTTITCILEIGRASCRERVYLCV